MNIDFFLGCMVGYIVTMFLTAIIVRKYRKLINSYEVLVEDIMESYKDCIDYSSGKITAEEYGKKLRSGIERSVRNYKKL